MRRRFFWGMVTVALTTLVVGGFAAAVLINRSVEASIRNEFARQAGATARLIEEDLPLAGSAGGDATRLRLTEVLRTVALVGGHDYVEAAVVGPRGTVTPLGDSAVLIDQVPSIADLARSIAFDGSVDGVAVTAIAQPFRLGERGTLVVVIGTTLDVVPWREVLLRFAWALVLALILASLLAGSLSRFAGRRLQGLHDASRAVAAGDLSVRVPVEGDDEVTAVGRAFNEMAEQLDGARRREREFLVAVGHDLRTPLTTIAGYAEALEEGRIGAEEQARVAAVLGTESGRLRRLVEDLMLLSRIEAREFSLRPEPVDLAGHLAGVLDGFRQRAGDARVRLVSEVEAVGMVDIDPDRIAQVTANLLENALRYTPEAGTVTLGLRRADQGLEIRVADTGPGIDPGDIPHVFERLYVATRYRPVRPEGSGLGLSIVNELVTAMGGSCTVTAEPGRGTTFAVLLPG